MKNRIFYRVSTAAVFTALIVLAVLQYRWVVSSAEKSIIELERSFSFSLQSTVAHEFRNFNNARQDSPPGREEMDDQNIRNAIGNFYSDFTEFYGTEYIASFSYYDAASPEDFYAFKEGALKKGNPLRVEIELVENYSGSPEFRDISIKRDENHRGRAWLVIRFRAKKDTYILINFHIDDFFIERIIPSIESLMDDSRINYSFTPPESGRIFKGKSYRFSPLKVLIDGVLANDASSITYLPYYLSPLSRFNKDGAQEFKYEDPYLYLDIRSAGKSRIRAKEYDFAIQWLVSLLLLAGVALAYSLILYQISNLRQLRLREKEFVASVTHELRTPLTVIRAAADNLKSGIISPERMEQYGHLIVDQSTRLSSMIEGILLFSRLEGKAEQPPRLSKTVFSLIEDDLKIVIESLKDEYNRNIILDFGSLPENALSDRQTIELILTNLITNSCKHAYNKDDSGEIRVKGHLQFPDSLIFTVEDDGSGIEKPERKHIFEPFFRGNRSFNNQIKGSGLGLYLSSRKARLLGGSLKVESPYERYDGKMRKGSHFVLKIPYYPLNEVSEV